MLKLKDSLNPLIVIIDNIKHSGTMLSKYPAKQENWTKMDKLEANQFMEVKPVFVLNIRVQN